MFSKFYLYSIIILVLELYLKNREFIHLINYKINGSKYEILIFF